MKLKERIDYFGRSLGRSKYKKDKRETSKKEIEHWYEYIYNSEELHLFADFKFELTKGDQFFKKFIKSLRVLFITILCLILIMRVQGSDPLNLSDFVCLMQTSSQITTLLAILNA